MKFWFRAEGKTIRSGFYIEPDRHTNHSIFGRFIDVYEELLPVRNSSIYIDGLFKVTTLSSSEDSVDDISDYLSIADIAGDIFTYSRLYFQGSASSYPMIGLDDGSFVLSSDDLNLIRRNGEFLLVKLNFEFHHDFGFKVCEYDMEC